MRPDVGRGAADGDVADAGADMTGAPRVGDRLVVSLCSDANDRLVRDVTVTVEKTQRLGCRCVRVETTRPGSTVPRSMHLHVDRCAFHQLNDPDGHTAATPAARAEAVS